MSEADLTFRVTVRELVEFVHRTGDLAGESGFRSSNRAVEGTRGHRRIQQARGPDYRAEVPVERAFERHGLRLILTGRVDGVFEQMNPPVVEEIKTVDSRWSGLPDAVHLAQLRVYAALLAQDLGWAEVEHHLTYLSLESDELTVFRETEPMESLAGFLDETLHQWFEWLAERGKWIQQRNFSLENLPFPFGSFREGQHALARTVYRAVRDGAHLFLEAPTGLGKTLATLYPAVRALPRMADGQVFYVTAKTPGRLAAADALERLRQAGARLRCVMLTAKKKICFSETPSGCDVRTCPFAIGYFDRVKPAVRQLLGEEILTREKIEEVARAFQVCPFELSLDASVWTDVVVGDLNYVFDPTARLQRHFGPGPARHVVLVDEAHNLVDRSRDMHSAALTPGDLEVAQGARRGKGGARVRRALLAVSNKVSDILRDADPAESLVPGRGYHDGGSARAHIPDGLLESARTAARRLEEFLSAQRPGIDLSGWIEPWFALTTFLRAAEFYDDSCRFLCLPAEDRVVIFCADPSARLRQVIKGLRSVVFFSATLTPMEYFQELLGGDELSRKTLFASPFAPSQMSLQVLGLDVTYKSRAETLTQVAAAVAGHFQSQAGNHLVFCPSLTYLAELATKLADHVPEDSLFTQSALMDEAAREAFLARLIPGGRVIALAVLGGVFAEGIDLPGKRLEGVTVIGVGLPRLSLERDVLQAHFQHTRGEGFDYAYRFPGMQRVLQAVGRLIRTESDRGSALLIDRRFTENRYRVLFPSWWGES